jgi:ABC-2 type transport system ATP-binding protein
LDNTPIISARGLNVRYGRRLALENVSFDVPGGAVGLLGPNGAGKSTLIRVILGFLRPESGEATVLGKRVSEDPLAARRRIGFVPEVDCHIPGMSAVRYVAYCGMLCGLPREDALQRAHEMLYYVGLGEERYRAVDEYSTGMKQRIKIAQALVHDPELLLLDEPTNGMDPRGRQELLELIKDVSSNKGIHAMVSSHLLPDVEFACSSVLMLHQGRVVGYGGLEELSSRRADHYQVKIRGNRQAVAEHLSQAGAEVKTAENDFLEVTLQNGLGSTAIFHAARACGAQVRGLEPSRDSLEEIFARALDKDAKDAGGDS